MAAVPSQDVTSIQPYNGRDQQDKSISGTNFFTDRDRRRFDELTFCTTENEVIIEETIETVKEKVWSFRAALKAAAEALVGYGLSPSTVGYSTVPLGDEDQLAQKNEAEAALQKVDNDEILSRPAYSGRLEDGGREDGPEEDKRLIRREDDYDENNHAFVEASRKDKDERKALTITWPEDDDKD